MILNVSKIKTESLLLFCKDIILSYQDQEIDTFDVNKQMHEYMDEIAKDMLKQLQNVTRTNEFYIEHANHSRIKAVLHGYNFLNQLLSKELESGKTFNPSMLYFSLLAMWFKELEKEPKSKEYIYFLLYPYGQVYDKLLLNIKDEKFKAVNISMIEIAERVVLKFDQLHFGQ